MQRIAINYGSVAFGAFIYWIKKQKHLHIILGLLHPGDILISPHHGRRKHILTFQKWMQLTIPPFGAIPGQVVLHITIQKRVRHTPIYTMRFLNRKTGISDMSSGNLENSRMANTCLVCIILIQAYLILKQKPCN